MSSPKRRLITTLILLIIVATIVPYQFAYIVACVVQIVSCIKALRFAKEQAHTVSGIKHWSFYHYSHSILMLMICLLPINIPVLLVWIRNLSVQWLTPFSSHHNVLSIAPFILLVETLTSGQIIPRIESRFVPVCVGMNLIPKRIQICHADFALNPCMVCGFVRCHVRIPPSLSHQCCRFLVHNSSLYFRMETQTRQPSKRII